MKNLRESKTQKSIFRRQSLWEQRKTQISLAVGAGVLVVIAGATLLVPHWRGYLEKWGVVGKLQGSANQIQSHQLPVLPLLSQPSQKRATQLEAIAQQPKSLDRNRARFLLANDLIQQKQGKKALAMLEGLEADYPVLAAHIVFKRAQTYELLGDKKKAQESWQDLLKRYPKEPVADEALYALSKSNPKYVEQAIAEFPSHPRTLEIVQHRLQQNPNQPKLILVLAKYGFNTTPADTSGLDRLVANFGPSLKPADWEAIAFDYWQNRQYVKASTAYEKAPHTPHNAYRVARALQLGGKRAEAKTAYEQLASEFPTARETGISLLQIAKLSKLEDEVPYLEQVIGRFPDSAGEALVTEAKVLDQLKSPKAAEDARQLLLSKYGSSEAAAEFRWNMAQKRAAAGDLLGAWKWAQPISSQNHNSKFAARAGFWVGKWATKLGRQQEAKASYEYVIAKNPQSYYAWRSAVSLSLPVGDFTTMRKLTPEVVQPSERAVLPVGSETLKELYQIHLDEDAWTLWQAEFQNRIQPTVAEQFTNGLMQLGRGQNLEAISLLSTLEDRETPQEQAEYQNLRKQPAYWQALYPFPFLETIETWSKQRQLNPLLVTALIRQESRFTPAIQSPAGAVGLMQVIPSTAKWIAPKINLKEYKLNDPKDNINLGTWFLDSTHQQYNNNSLLAVASYNAGPGNVSKWLKDKASVDPDEFVETIPFEETRGYVKNVFGNYWNYLRLYNPQTSQVLAKYSAAQETPLPE